MTERIANTTERFEEPLTRGTRVRSLRGSLAVHEPSRSIRPTSGEAVERAGTTEVQVLTCAPCLTRDVTKEAGEVRGTEWSVAETALKGRQLSALQSVEWWRRFAIS